MENGISMKKDLNQFINQNFAFDIRTLYQGPNKTYEKYAW